MILKKYTFPFTYAYCISLVHSVNRRQWIEGEFKKNKITDYEFIDAVNKDDQIVEDAYKYGLVKLFPPCFRCGKDVCNCDNNVLIKTQVATFLSHMQVWETIEKKKSGMYLIIEDDIKFNKYYRVMRLFFHKKINEFLYRRDNKPLLLRLAWANNEEHKLQKFKIIDGLVRMSNPMYSINPEMAKALLKDFRTINTTVDIYLHRDVGKKYDNYTVMPPLAYDLSYSHGAVESLIRPRSKRIEELLKRNDICSKEELSRYDNHVDKAIRRKLLIIGCLPHAGSSYISTLLNTFGLDVDHEKMGADGIVSWMFAVHDLNNPYYFDKHAQARYFVSFENTIMFVHDPFTAIPIIMRENITSDVLNEFIEKHILKNYRVSINAIENKLERAIETYYLWSKLAIRNNKPDLIVRVEKDEDVLLEYLKNHNIKVGKGNLSEKDIIKNPKLRKESIDEPLEVCGDWLELDSALKIRLNELCVMLKYSPIFNDSLSVVNR
jgi:GR25 family glycosyltransferase involved in LPS biosynthesis